MTAILRGLKKNSRFFIGIIQLLQITVITTVNTKNDHFKRQHPDLMTQYFIHNPCMAPCGLYDSSLTQFRSLYQFGCELPATEIKLQSGLPCFNDRTYRVRLVRQRPLSRQAFCPVDQGPVRSIPPLLCSY